MIRRAKWLSFKSTLYLFPPDDRANLYRVMRVRRVPARNLSD